MIALSACSAYQPYTEKAEDGFYIVQPGDNLDLIAFAHETTPERLQRANPWMTPESLQSGMRLTIPQPSTGSISESTPTLSSPRKFIWPLRKLDISSKFGIRSGRMHNGIDLRAPRGTPIYASANGRVMFSGVRRGFGKTIVIDHGGGIETVYAHNESNLVTAGQRVQQGEIIARVGRSGRATGYHLHFEYRRNGRALDPARYL
ncbi:MAG: LysM peptidoglycan-binding domain-containing M23 family metallopeptidase [Pseudomonadota bacterium]